MDRDVDNIVRIDGRRNSNKPVKKSKGNGMKPEYAGVAIFLLVFIYMVVNLYLYYIKERVSIYEVQEENLVYDDTFEGIIVRDETLVYADTAGYINYYVREGKRIAKDAVIYSVDAGDASFDRITESGQIMSFTEDKINKIKSVFLSYRSQYNSNSFDSICEFNETLHETVNEIIHNDMLETLLEIQNDSSMISAFTSVTGSASGVVSYYADNLNGIKVTDISAQTFEDKDNYEKTNLRTGRLIGASEPVYRLSSEESWHIVVKLEESFYLKLLEEDTIKIRINNDSLILPAKLEVWQEERSYFADVMLDEYMVRYLNDRFVEVEFMGAEEEGYKIPLSSITKKEFYLVPLEYFNSIEGYNSKVLAREVYDSINGKVEYDYIEATIYYDDGTYAYVDTDLFAAGTHLFSSQNNTSYKIGLVNVLEGVYNVNKGYAVFRRIERMRENDEYCIVKKGTSWGLSLYDHIALDASTATESAIIY